MKRLVMILAAAGMCMTLGCEKRVGQAEDADRFDEKIDGPTCVLTVIADENLLADQKKISRQAKLAAETPAEIEEKTDDEDTGDEDTTPAPAGDSAGAVRQVMAGLIADFKAGRMDQFADALPSADAATLRKFFNDFDKLNQKDKTLAQLFRTKLKMEPPPDMRLKTKKDATKIIVYAIFGVNFSQVSLDDLDIKQVGETVVISGPSVRKVMFSKDGQAWKIQLSPDARQLTGLLDEIVAITEKMNNDLISGINNGSVTKDNHRAKMDEIEQRHSAVMGAKLRELMPKLLIPSMMPASATPPASNTPVAKPTVEPAVVPRPRPDERRSDEDRRRPGGREM